LIEVISTDGTYLYYISFYLESHRLHTKHVFIYATKKGTEKKIERTHKKKRKRTITGRRFMRENRYAYPYTTSFVIINSFLSTKQYSIRFDKILERCWNYSIHLFVVFDLNK
jgi:hypothetical protein